jgi:hypothetical protein
VTGEVNVKTMGALQGVLWEEERGRRVLAELFLSLFPPQSPGRRKSQSLPPSSDHIQAKAESLPSPVVAIFQRLEYFTLPSMAGLTCRMERGERSPLNSKFTLSN